MSNLIYKASQKIKFNEFFIHYNKYGEVPPDFVTPDGYPLGKNIINLRIGYILSEEEKKYLRENGFRLSIPAFDFDLFLKYYKIYGDKKITFSTLDGYPLGRVIYKIRHNKIVLLSSQKQILKDNDFVWGKEKFNFEKFYNYFLEYGNVKSGFVIEDGYKLGNYQFKIRTSSIKLTKEQYNLLNDNGFIWKLYDRDYKFEI